jgi:hypothetical protein
MEVCNVSKTINGVPIKVKDPEGEVGDWWSMNHAAHPIRMPEKFTLEQRKARAWMTDREWFESGGSKIGPSGDLIREPARDKVANLNDPQGDVSGEQAMWGAVIRQAIDDAGGVQMEAHRTCKKNGCGSTAHTIQQCAREWLASESLDYWAEMCGLEASEVRRRLSGGAVSWRKRAGRYAADARMKVSA